MKKKSKANLTPKRQRTQYSCMSTSMSMCLQALGYSHANEDEVNKVMGALPMKGAAWEQALACAQHYGCRATLTTPSTVTQLKGWTDRGIPVMIAWNPEGRDWSHASVVFDVDDELNVYIADPNIPDPDETVRVVSKTEFYSKWYEKWPNYLVRRPACAIEREITPDGKQIMASNQKENNMSSNKTASDPIREMRDILKTLESAIDFVRGMADSYEEGEIDYAFEDAINLKEYYIETLESEQKMLVKSFNRRMASKTSSNEEMIEIERKVLALEDLMKLYSRS